MPRSASEEKRLTSLFQAGQNLHFEDERWTVEYAGKPRAGRGGEGKTDIFVCVSNPSLGERHIKISHKQSNADFLENKMSHERAQQIFGNPALILTPALETFAHKLSPRLPEHARGVTLGWRLDVDNKGTRRLAAPIAADTSILRELYAGERLSPDKRDGFVRINEDETRQIRNSGVASHMLVSNPGTIRTAQGVLDALIPMEEYITKDENSRVFLTANAVNYRKGGKYERGRALGLYYDYERNPINPPLRADNPLQVTSTMIVIGYLPKAIKDRWA